MFWKVLGVLGDIPAVEIGDAEIKQDIKKVREIEQGLVGAVWGITQKVRHLAVDAQNPEWLHQQVQEQQENDILDEAVLHLIV